MQIWHFLESHLFHTGIFWVSMLSFFFGIKSCECCDSYYAFAAPGNLYQFHGWGARQGDCVPAARAAELASTTEVGLGASDRVILHEVFDAPQEGPAWILCWISWRWSCPNAVLAGASTSEYFEITHVFPLRPASIRPYFFFSGGSFELGFIVNYDYLGLPSLKRDNHPFSGAISVSGSVYAIIPSVCGFLLLSSDLATEKVKETLGRDGFLLGSVYLFKHYINWLGWFRCSDTLRKFNFSRCLFRFNAIANLWYSLKP